MDQEDVLSAAAAVIRALVADVKELANVLRLANGKVRLDYRFPN